MASKQRSIALAFCESFKNLDVEANLALRTPDCSHIMAPASVNYSTMTNDQWAAHLSSLKPILSTFPVTATEIFAEERSNQVTVWATSDAKFREDVKDDEDPGLDWSYRGEYIFILVLNHAGDKIERIVEFLDSKKVDEVRVLLARARRNIATRE